MEWIKKYTRFFPNFLAPAVALLRRMNIEMTNTLMSHMHLYNEEAEEQMKGEFEEEKNWW